jgi:hypothetical protein
MEACESIIITRSAIIIMDIACEIGTIRSLRYRMNIVDMSRRSTTYETRLLKYATRGFGIGVAGLDIDTVSIEL